MQVLPKGTVSLGQTRAGALARNGVHCNIKPDPKGPVMENVMDISLSNITHALNCLLYEHI